MRNNLKINEVAKEFIIEIEKILGSEIPIVEKFDWKHFGIQLEEDTIIGIELQDKNLSVLPESLKTLSSLRNLHLGKNKFNEIPPGIEFLQKLERLYLQNNKIASIPNWFSKLTNLTEINIGFRRIYPFTPTLYL